ncbi:MAG TPA: M28 family peptidase, partial [Iamia sp.]
DCYPLPHAAPTTGVELALTATPTEGRAALVDAPLVRLPATAVAGFGSAPDGPDGATDPRRVFDPDATLADEEHVLPHTALRNRIVEPVVEAGAVAFVGTLVDHPGDLDRYYVPYHGEALPLPGVWIRGSEGERLHADLDQGPVTLHLVVESTRVPAETQTIVGDLPGRDDELVLVGSHHDGPWASAVEDGTGIALVLAQAAHWAAVPAGERPHRLRFVLHGGHMAGGAGHRSYVQAHADDLDRVVLAVHLEHAALDVADHDGELVPTGRCVPRWFFTSRIPPLEAAVIDAIEDHDLRRSLLVAPDALGANPPTDGARLHPLGVPIVQLLGAPWYLFDEVDTIDKVDVDALVPLTRATADVVAWTAGRTAAEVRAAATGAG